MYTIETLYFKKHLKILLFSFIVSNLDYSLVYIIILVETSYEILKIKKKNSLEKCRLLSLPK